MMFPHCFNISNDLTSTSFQFLKNCFKQFSHADIRNSTRLCWAVLVIEPVNIHWKHIAAVFCQVKSDVERFMNSGSKFLQSQRATEGADPSNVFLGAMPCDGAYRLHFTLN